MYGYYLSDTDNYKINIYFAGPDGFVKYPVTTVFHLPEDKTIEQETKLVKEKPLYVPELDFVTEYDFRTYWQDTFDIYVKAFDTNKNPSPEFDDFDGAVHDADVTVIITQDDDKVATI